MYSIIITDLVLISSFLKKLFSRLFAQFRKEINLKREVPLTIAGATSHHAIRQASLKEAYTSYTNIWTGDIYKRSLQNVIRILLQIHLAPARMKRYQDIQRRKAERKAEKKQTDKEKQDPGRQFRKSRISQLMDELAMAIINNRPAFVVQNIRQKLQQLSQPPARDIQQNRAVDIFSDVEDAEDTEEEEEEEEDQDPESSAKTIR